PSDMLGRNNFVQSAGPNGSVLWTVTDSNGNQQTFRLDYTNINVTTNFCPLRTGHTGGSNPCSEYGGTWQVPSRLPCQTVFTTSSPGTAMGLCSGSICPAAGLSPTHTA